MSARRLSAVAATALLLASCGQRGALYIPEPRGEPVAQPAASPVPAPTEDEQERARREAARTGN